MNNPTQFNDPFDCIMAFDNAILESAIVKNIIGNVPLVETTELKNILNEKREMLRNDFKTTCFAENYNSLLMWSHYSDKYKGFCIEYDFLEDEYMRRSLNPIVYTKMLPLE